MARLARGQTGFYKLRPPAVVGPIAILPTLTPAKRVAVLDRAKLAPQRRTTSVLRPPTVVFPLAAGPLAQQTTVELAGGKRRGRWRLTPPVAIFAAAVVPPPVVTGIRTSLANTRVQYNVRRKVRYFVAAPQSIVQPVSVPTQDQLTIRTGPHVRIKPPAVHWAWINPAVINPVVLNHDAQVRHKNKLVAVAARRALPRTFYKRWPTPYFTLVAIQPATVNFTSTVSGTVLRLAAAQAATVNFTSVVTAGLVRQRSLPGNITFTATMTGAIGGGNQGTQIASFPTALLYILMGDD